MKKSFLILTFLLLPVLARAGSSFSGERLKNAVLTFVSSTVVGESTVEIINKIPDYKFSEDDVSASFDCNANMLKGYTNLYIEFYSNNELIKRDEITLKVRVFDFVPTITKNMRKGDLITSSDVVLVKQDITNKDKSKLPTINELIGKSISKSINKGMIVTNDEIEDVKSVKKGEKIEIIVDIGNIIIRSYGKALSDGTKGELIPIQREGSTTTIYGTVLSSGKVIIKEN